MAYISEQIQSMIELNAEGLYELSKKVYDYLKNLEGDQDKCLKEIFEINDGRGFSIDSEKEDYPLIAAKLRLLEAEKGKAVDGMLCMLIKRMPSEDEFYQSLWNELINNPMFEDDEARAFALYYVWIDKQVPYFKLTEGFQMPDEQYKAAIKEMKPIFQKMRYAVYSCGYVQRTQRAGAIYNLMKELGSEEKEILFFSRLIAEYEKSIIEVLKSD